MIMLISSAMLLTGDPTMAAIGTGIWAVFTWMIYN